MAVLKKRGSRLAFVHGERVVAGRRHGLDDRAVVEARQSLLYGTEQDGRTRVLVFDIDGEMKDYTRNYLYSFTRERRKDHGIRN